LILKLTDSFSLSEDAVARTVGEEIMLLDLASGTYFGLDGVGGRFWQLLEEGLSGVEARDTMLDEFEVAVEQIDADLNDLVAQLADKGLITPN
jgi:hypothetical protein